MLRFHAVKNVSIQRNQETDATTFLVRREQSKCIILNSLLCLPLCKSFTLTHAHLVSRGVTYPCNMGISL